MIDVKYGISCTGYGGLIEQPKFDGLDVRVFEILDSGSCIRNKFLDELDPEAGREQKIITPDCGNFCDIEFSDVLHPRLDEVYEEPTQLKLL